MSDGPIERDLDLLVRRLLLADRQMIFPFQPAAAEQQLFGTLCKVTPDPKLQAEIRDAPQQPELHDIEAE